MENLYRNSIPRLLIIVPCYNEEEVLPETINRLAEQISLLRQQQLISVGNILLVDDGSTDGTWQIIESYAQQKREVAGLKLVHNSGHQQALWAANAYLLFARNRYCIWHQKREKNGYFLETFFCPVVL